MWRGYTHFRRQQQRPHGKYVLSEFFQMWENHFINPEHICDCIKSVMFMICWLKVEFVA